jgi:hypothetical protein
MDAENAKRLEPQRAQMNTENALLGSRRWSGDVEPRVAALAAFRAFSLFNAFSAFICVHQRFQFLRADPLT